MTEDVRPGLDPAPDLTESLDLVDRARGGDGAALGELLRRYQTRLRRIVRVRMGERFGGAFDSMDVVQDTCLLAAQHIGDFTPTDHGAILAWLARIAQNLVADAADKMHAQKRDRRREQALDGEDGARPLSASTTSPSQAAARNELVELYDACVAELPERQREVLLLRDYGLSEWAAVAAQVAAPSVAAAQELYRRARLRLGQRLRERLGD